MTVHFSGEDVVKGGILRLGGTKAGGEADKSGFLFRIARCAKSEEVVACGCVTEIAAGIGENAFVVGDTAMAEDVKFVIIIEVFRKFCDGWIGRASTAIEIPGTPVIWVGYCLSVDDQVTFIDLSRSNCNALKSTAHAKD